MGADDMVGTPFSPGGWGNNVFDNYPPLTFFQTATLYPKILVSKNIRMAHNLDQTLRTMAV